MSARVSTAAADRVLQARSGVSARSQACVTEAVRESLASQERIESMCEPAHKPRLQKTSRCLSSSAMNLQAAEFRSRRLRGAEFTANQ